MTTAPIIAKVGEPTPMERPPCPTLYAVRYFGAYGWTIGYENDSRKWCEMMMERHPGSRLVIVPGETP